MANILEVENAAKTFAGQRALRGIDFDLRAGEVHALVGPNGCGKSTFAKILSGFHPPDSGMRARLFGAEVEFPLNFSAQHKLHFVHQDLGLIGGLNVLDNIGLSETYKVGRFGRIDWKHSMERARAALRPFGLDQINMYAPVADLTATERAIVAIARGLLGWEDGLGILVLDETTAALPPKEVNALEGAIREVVRGGSGIIYITHRLDEVFNFADRVTVLRDGDVSGVFNVPEINEDVLVTAMIGSKLIAKKSTHQPGGRVALECRNLCSDGLVDVNLRVREGEIVGVAGILGSGRESLADVIFGAKPQRGGATLVSGEPARHATPRRSLDRGVVLVPSDRKRRGIIPALSLRENMTVAWLAPLWRWVGLSRTLEVEEVNRWAARVDIRPPNMIESPISTFSGGNQQKAVVARCLRLNPVVLLLDEALQGVDVAAKSAIYDLIRNAAIDGMAVLLCTSEPEDLPDVCHRVLIMRGGTIVEELAGAGLTRERVIAEASK